VALEIIFIVLCSHVVRRDVFCFRCWGCGEFGYILIKIDFGLDDILLGVIEVRYYLAEGILPLQEEGLSPSVFRG